MGDHILLIPFPALGNLPVLTVRALEVTSDRGYGKGGCPGKEMIQRFFFDRVHMSGYDIAVNMSEECSLSILSHSADSEFCVSYLTAVMAEGTRDLTVRERAVEHGFFDHPQTRCLSLNSPA